MDVPFMSLKHVFTKDNTKRDRPRYEPYGIMVKKNLAYPKGARPVLNLSDEEIARLNIPQNELWRVVKLDVDKSGNWISWLHEREWRKKGNFPLPSNTAIAALVKTPKEVKELSKFIENKKCKCKPYTVIPLRVVCQGLTLM